MWYYVTHESAYYNTISDKEIQRSKWQWRILAYLMMQAHKRDEYIAQKEARKNPYSQYEGSAYIPLSDTEKEKSLFTLAPERLNRTLETLQTWSLRAETPMRPLLRTIMADGDQYFITQGAGNLHDTVFPIAALSLKQPSDEVDRESAIRADWEIERTCSNECTECFRKGQHVLQINHALELEEPVHEIGQVPGDLNIPSILQIVHLLRTEPVRQPY